MVGQSVGQILVNSVLSIFINIRQLKYKSHQKNGNILKLVDKYEYIELRSLPHRIKQKNTHLGIFCFKIV